MTKQIEREVSAALRVYLSSVIRAVSEMEHSVGLATRRFLAAIEWAGLKDLDAARDSIILSVKTTIDRTLPMLFEQYGMSASLPSSMLDYSRYSLDSKLAKTMERVVGFLRENAGCSALAIATGIIPSAPMSEVYAACEALISAGRVRYETREDTNDFSSQRYRIFFLIDVSPELLSDEVALDELPNSSVDSGVERAESQLR